MAQTFKYAIASHSKDAGNHLALVKWNERTARGTKLCRAQWTNFGGGMLDENSIWP